MNRKIKVLFTLLLLGLIWSGPLSAEGIKGTVASLSGDVVIIRKTSTLIPNPGDKVTISFSTPDGDVIPVGTWEVEKVEGNNVHARVLEALGSVNVGMKAEIHSENAISPPPSDPVRTTRMPAPAVHAGEVPGSNSSGAEQPQSPTQNLTPDDFYKKAKNFYDNKDYSQSAQMFSKAAEQGHAGAQGFLGWSYQYGEGVPIDYTKALSWYEKAAKGGNSSALTNLGIMYRDGQGVTRNYSKAMKWFRKAANKDFSYGYWNLGKMTENGWGTKKNPKKALGWYRKAAEKGLVGAQNTVGRFYQFGTGVKKDYAEAHKWYLKAAQQNHADAQNSLGLFYLSAWGVPLDYSEAVKWFSKAAESGHSYGYFNLGRLYENGWGVPQDYDKAMEYYNKFGDYVEEYKKGARQGNQESRNWLNSRDIAWDTPRVQPNVQARQPQRGGYQKQMKQEQQQRNREAAGKLLPELMKMRNDMIKGMNR